MKTGAIPISAALLAEGVLRTMPLTRLIVAAIGLFAVTLFTAGIGWLAAGERPAQVGPGRVPQALPRRKPSSYLGRSHSQAARTGQADGNGRDAQTVAVPRG